MASQVENATSHSAMKVVQRMWRCRLLFYVALEVKMTRLHCYRVRRLRNDIMLRKNKLRLTRLSLSASRSQLLRLSTCPTVPNVETPIDLSILRTRIHKRILGTVLSGPFATSILQSFYSPSAALIPWDDAQQRGP